MPRRGVAWSPAVADEGFGGVKSVPVARRQELKAGVHAVREGVDHEVAEIKLENLGVGLDELTEDQ